MAFKGVVHVGSDVTAKLELGATASAPAFLLMAYGRSGGTPSEDGDQAAPGGFARLSMTMDAKGRLRINVDMAAEADTGRLIVTEAETVKDAESITGDTAWVYAVVPGGGGDA